MLIFNLVTPYRRIVWVGIVTALKSYAVLLTIICRFIANNDAPLAWVRIHNTVYLQFLKIDCWLYVSPFHNVSLLVRLFHNNLSAVEYINAFC